MNLTFILPLVLWIGAIALFLRGEQSRALWLAGLWLAGAVAAWFFGLYISWIALQAMLAVVALLLLTSTEH